MTTTTVSLIFRHSSSRILSQSLSIGPKLRSRRSVSLRSFSSFPDEQGKSHAKTYHIQGSTTPDNKSSVTMKTNTGHSLQTDLPKRMGGQDEAPQPVETLLAALTGCTQATALFVGRQMIPDRLQIERMEFFLTATRDERGALQLPIAQNPPVPSRLQLVTGTIHVFLRQQKSITPHQMAALREQTELRCPVANMMLASGCEIDVEWIDGSAL